MFYGAKKRRRMGRQHIHTCNIYMYICYVCLYVWPTLEPFLRVTSQTKLAQALKKSAINDRQRSVKWKKQKKTWQKSKKKIYKFGLFIIKMAVCYLNSRYRCCCRPRLRCRCCCCRLALSFKENTHTHKHAYLHVCVCVWPRKLCCQNKNV